MAGSIIPPSMANEPNIMVSYMDPIRHKDGSWEFDLTIHSINNPPQRTVNCQFRVLTRNAGLALADAIREVVMKEVPPPIHSATKDFTDEN